MEDWIVLQSAVYINNSFAPSTLLIHRETRDIYKSDYSVGRIIGVAVKCSKYLRVYSEEYKNTVRFSVISKRSCLDSIGDAIYGLENPQTWGSNGDRSRIIEIPIYGDESIDYQYYILRENGRRYALKKEISEEMIELLLPRAFSIHFYSVISDEVKLFTIGRKVDPMVTLQKYFDILTNAYNIVAKYV